MVKKFTKTDIEEIEDVIKAEFSKAIEAGFFFDDIISLSHLHARLKDDGVEITLSWSV